MSARYCGKYFKEVLKFQQISAISSLPFYNCRNCNLEKTGNLFKVAQQTELDFTLIWLQSQYSMLWVVTDDSKVWVEVLH